MFLPFFVCACGLGILDLKRISVSDHAHWASDFFPVQQGKSHFARGEYAAAFLAFKTACLRDPYGPESVFNVSQTAFSLSQNPEDRWARLGFDGLILCDTLFPNFSLPRREFQRLDVAAGYKTELDRRKTHITYSWDTHRVWLSILERMDPTKESDSFRPTFPKRP